MQSAYYGIFDIAEASDRLVTVRARREFPSRVYVLGQRRTRLIVVPNIFSLSAADSSSVSRK